MTKAIAWLANGRLKIFRTSIVSSSSIGEIADKVVPSGIKYAIIEASEIPADRSSRNHWTIDESDLKLGG